MFGDNIKGDKFTGDKVMGDKKTYEIHHIDLDIGVLKDILETNPKLIEETLQQLKTIPSEFAPDERTVPISIKNLQNGLVEFYNEFICNSQQKLRILLYKTN